VKKVLAIRHVEIEGLGSFEPLLRKLSFEVEYVDTPKGMTPSLPVKEYALVFVLGGYMGVYEVEKYPFLKVGFQVIEDALKAGVPFIGVCLGAQMLAHVLGAKVYPGEKGKELGWLPVFKTGEHPFFEDWDKKLTVFQLHGDTFDLPKGAVRVYSSEKYPNQAFVYENAIGLQFHIEVDQELARLWAETYQVKLEQPEIKEEELAKLKSLAQKLLKKLVKK